MHSYQLIYDFGNDVTMNCWWPAAILLAVALGMAMLRRARQAWAMRLAIVALLAASTAAALPCWQKQRMLAALRHRQVKVVEGALRGYWNRPAESEVGGKREWLLWENFTVDGVLFGYYRGQSQPGFSNAAKPNVEFKDGMQLRIAYLEDDAGELNRRRILRLEIADKQFGIAKGMAAD